MIPSDRLYIATGTPDARIAAASHGLGLEVRDCCDAARMDSAACDEAIRQALSAVSADRVLLHAPFEGLSPAFSDPLLRRAVQDRLHQTCALAAKHGIHRIVMHSGYLPALCPDDVFVDRAASFWQALLQAQPGTTFFITNIWERDPEPLLALLSRVSSPSLRLCLNISAAQAGATPLDVWIDRLAPHIGHVRLPEDASAASMRRVVMRLLAAAPEAAFTVQGAKAADSAPAFLPADFSGDPARAQLQRIYGYDNFRQGQREVIDALLAGRDALAIMPTGSGKSVCFQIPALLSEGVTLVVSPLISLMKDQVEALKQVGVRAAYLNSSLTERQFALALQNAASGLYKLIYVAPERLLTPRFLAFAQGGANIAAIAVDEAHCISQWGQEFRPSYLDIPSFVNALPRRPTVSAFTATATEKVKADILRLLALQSPAQVQTGFDRPNLHYCVLRPRKKQDALIEQVRRFPGQSGIVYCATRKAVEQVCDILRDLGVRAARYHAGLPDAERRQQQEDFTFDRADVIVATNAFGMGIDKSNVRFILHYNMPKDIESYYQEAGRAGRDGEDADCILLYSPQDERIQRMLIEHEEEGESDPAARNRLRTAAYQRLADMVAYCRTGKCLRGHILRYFGEDAPLERCDNCGNCQSAAAATDMTALALPILRCVSSTGQRFGLGTILALLRGAKTERLERFDLQRHPDFGLLRDASSQKLSAVGEQLVSEGYLRMRPGKLPIAELGPRAAEALQEGAQVMLTIPEHTASARTRARKPKARPAADSSVSARPADPSLFEALRAQRLRLATERGVPAFVIATDATLREMSSAAPRTLAEMHAVRGLGKQQLAQYGDAFLRAIQDHLARA